MNTEIQQTFKIMSIQDMQNRYSDFAEFSKSILKKDLDYGVIPWVNKPSLLKPWAEKLRVAYGLGVEITRTGDTLSLDKDFYDVNYIATVTDKYWRTLAQCEWSANTMEDKYRYQRVMTDKKPSKEEADKLKAMKLGRWSKYWNDWVRMEKAEAKNRLSLKNTIQKMAQKRAFVGAMLIATWASEFFTQDVEDMNIWGAEVVEVKQEETKQEVKEEKKRFNQPEIKNLENDKEYINKFATPQELIEDIKKRYRVSKTKESEIEDIRTDNYWVVEEKDPKQIAEEKMAEPLDEEVDLPF